MSVVLMSKRELNRIDILARLESGRLTPAAAAELLRVSERQVYRLQRRFRDDGPSEIADRRRGRPSSNRLSDALREHAVSSVRQHYADFGPTLAAEKLEERHALRISRETLRTWMIQIDGCEHRWFEDRGPPCTLLVFVNDTTSRLMALGFVPSESAFAYFEMLRRYLDTHGKPVVFYSDKHSIFRVSKAEASSGDDMTQFGRALLHELNIEILCANTSQVKERVERAHATLHSRLVKELRLACGCPRLLRAGRRGSYEARRFGVQSETKGLRRTSGSSQFSRLSKISSCSPTHTSMPSALIFPVYKR